MSTLPLTEIEPPIGAQITLAQVHEAIAQHLRTRLPNALVAQYYPQIGQRIRVPACLFELDELTDAATEGSGRLVVHARFTAYCLAAREQQDAHLVVREMAARVMHALWYCKRLGVAGLGVQRPVQASEDSIRPELESYLCWSVQWYCELPLGEIEDAALSGVVPVEIRIGYAPDVGSGSEQNYTTLMP